MMVWTVLFWAFIVCFAFMLLMGYSGIARLAGALYRLGDYAGKLRTRGYGRGQEDGGFVPFTVVLPGCEQTQNPEKLVRHHLELDYPDYELVVVCDGGKNATLAKLQAAFKLLKIDQPIKRSVPMGAVRGVYRTPAHENLIVVDKAPAGLADALNCGLNLSRYPLVVTAGPTRWLHAEGLWRLAEPFALQYGCEVVGGLPRLRVASGGTSGLRQMNLLVQYPAGLAVPGQRRLPIVPEGYGAFRKTALVEQGGFAGEGAELDAAARLFAAGENKKAGVQLLPQPFCGIEPQKGLAGLWRSCVQQKKEMGSALRRCRKLVFRPRFGRTGMWDVPVLALTRLLGPVLEVLGMALSLVLFVAGLLPATLFWGFWLAMVLFAALTSLAALLCQQVEEADDTTGMRRFLRKVGSALLLPLGFYQLLLVLNVAALFARKK